MNAKEMMMWDLGAKNTKQIKTLEEQTGVNLDHYYKLNIQINNSNDFIRCISNCYIHCSINIQLIPIR